MPPLSDETLACPPCPASALPWQDTSPIWHACSTPKTPLYCMCGLLATVQYLVCIARSCPARVCFCTRRSAHSTRWPSFERILAFGCHSFSRPKSRFLVQNRAHPPVSLCAACSTQTSGHTVHSSDPTKNHVSYIHEHLMGQVNALVRRQPCSVQFRESGFCYFCLESKPDCGSNSNNSAQVVRSLTSKPCFAV